MGNRKKKLIRQNVDTINVKRLLEKENTNTTGFKKRKKKRDNAAGWWKKRVMASMEDESELTLPWLVSLEREP